MIVDGYKTPPIHILDAETGDYISSLGTNGEGPGEFSSARTIDDVSSEQQGIVAAWIYDSKLRRITYVDINAFLKDAFQLNERMLTLGEGGMPLSPTWLNDTLLISPGLYFGGERFARFNKNGELIDLVGNIPFLDPGVLQARTVQSYMSVAKAKPDKSRLALVTLYADQLEIYSSACSLLTVVRGPDQFKPALQGSPDRRYGYFAVTATDAYIIGLYSGDAHDTRGWGNYLHVFDWDGNLLRVFKPDVKLDGIAASRDGRTLYATQLYPTVAIRTFSLPDM